MYDHDACKQRGLFNISGFCNGCGDSAPHWYRRKAHARFTRCWHEFGDRCTRCGMGLELPPAEKKEKHT